MRGRHAARRARHRRRRRLQAARRRRARAPGRAASAATRWRSASAPRPRARSTASTSTTRRCSRCAARSRACERGWAPRRTTSLVDGKPHPHARRAAHRRREGDARCYAHRLRVDRRQGHARPAHARARAPLSGVRLGAQRRLRHARAPAGARASRPHAAPPPSLLPRVQLELDAAHGVPQTADDMRSDDVTTLRRALRRALIVCSSRGRRLTHRRRTPTAPHAMTDTSVFRAGPARRAGRARHRRRHRHRLRHRRAARRRSARTWCSRAASPSRWSRRRRALRARRGQAVDGAARRARSGAREARSSSSVAGERGRIDLLVNNAAGNFYAPSETLCAERVAQSWSRSTCTAPSSARRPCMPVMKAQGGGRIVSISMTLHYRGWPLMAHATAAKAGVDALTRTLARGVGAAPHPRQRHRAGPDPDRGRAQGVHAAGRQRRARRVRRRRRAHGKVRSAGDPAAALGRAARHRATWWPSSRRLQATGSPGAIFVVDGGEWLAKPGA